MEITDKFTLEQRYRVVIMLLVIGVFTLLTEACENSRESEASLALYQQAQAELVVWKDAEGKGRAKIATLVSDNLGAFAQLETQDSTILHLKEVVEKYKKELKKKGSITVIEVVGEVEGTVPTVVTNKDSTKYDPIYKSTFNFSGWVFGETVATKDSTSITIKYKEKLDIVIGEEKTGFLGLGKAKRFVDVTIHNPYSTVKELRVFEKEETPPKRFSVGPGIHYGIGSGFTPQIYVGVGAQYSLIRF